MKIKIIKEELIQYYKITYDNDLICEYNLVNGKLNHYSFKKNNLIYKYCDNIDEYTNKHWSDNDYQKLPILSLKELQEFNSFDKLFYFGAGMDGKTIDFNGVELSTPIILSDTTCQIYLDIETSEKECQDILNKLVYGEYFVKRIIKIPPYNWDSDKKEQYTISLKFKLPQDVYTKLIQNNEDSFGGKYYNDIFNYLKSGII